ncbi:hypothetical protein KOAAANKH_02538 [Brevundimonas sp. NIBR10]|uniref:hypothetical protein n=1 Tax=Brevundimonas sp. NIBR10 TaxID=3015997 RepID=UPI0022F1530D|nr:hypothetical protein [Brevundimonas sp. NIBR10]WGM47656.1 hypothetical protein KOAAANKH_02538 [Brevundimonas sp. NIBR10]
MTRRADVFARVARGQNRIDPDRQAVRLALQFVTALPEWAVLLDYLDHRERQITARSDAEDAGALLRSAGRRSLLREIEGLDERVIDDDRSDQPE